jgi:hypothetical protein
MTTASGQTERERFFSEGGKEIDVEIIERGAELTTADIAQNRDLKLYEDGGHVDCRHWREDRVQPPSDCEGKVRTFIWNHWKRHHRGYIRLTGNSVDSTSTMHVFVEPGEGNEWVIVIRNVNSWYGSPDSQQKIYDSPPATSIHFIKEKSRRGTETKLLLKAKDGYEITTL